MPIYEFKCTSGYHYHTEPVVFERLYNTLEQCKADDERGAITCPQCHSTFVRRLTSQTARPQFKGSGFYETDYKT
jgi:predicted nucleic acid-binding Zn ribbon protein